MRNVPARFSAEITAILHEAYYKIANQMSGEHYHYDVFNYVRATMFRIISIDCFFVGLLHGANKVRYPYGWEGKDFDDPQSHSIVPNGPTAWLLKNRRTYRYAYDDGTALHAGIACGDVTRPSADAVFVPIFDPGGGAGGREILGMISMQSYASNHFTDESVSALEWLAELVAFVLTKEREEQGLLAQIGLSDQIDSSTLTSEHVLEFLAGHFGWIRRTARAAAQESVPATSELQETLAEIAERCARVQSELVEMGLRMDLGPGERFERLTAAERSVAMLLLADVTNQQIADELGISLNTVKTHLGNILKKYEMRDRLQVTADLRRHLGT